MPSKALDVQSYRNRHVFPITSPLYGVPNIILSWLSYENSLRLYYYGTKMDIYMTDGDVPNACEV